MTDRTRLLVARTGILVAGITRNWNTRRDFLAGDLSVASYNLLCSGGVPVGFVLAIDSKIK